MNKKYLLMKYNLDQIIDQSVTVGIYTMLDQAYAEKVRLSLPNDANYFIAKMIEVKVEVSEE